jgi:general nucleoside transport system ATP-binding protein
VIHLSHIVKIFGATRAVDDVSLEVRRGEIVALVGENGAGKTTLMRIAAGEIVADGGSVNREGRAELVHQHFLLVDALTIAENLALTHRGFRFTTRRMIEREAASIIASTGIELRDVSRLVAELSVGERSKLELIKAIARKPATLILDEPTSVLTPNETTELFRVMRRIAAEGTAVVFISHKLPEVLEVAERIIVMRAGRVVAESAARDTNVRDLANAMVGRVTEQPSNRATAGTITAIVGVAGNGQAELAAKLRDEERDAGHIPEDRTRDGIVAEMTIAENLALKAKRWNARDAAKHAEQMIAMYSIRASSPLQRAGDLSGGNQQKVILARELDRKPKRIVAAEPTRGLDIEATRFVHEQLRSAAAEGASILLITSDLDEAFALADTIQVIYRGSLSDPLTPAEAATRVASLMAGVA